jgi:hypothetical protein
VKHSGSGAITALFLHRLQPTRRWVSPCGNGCCNNEPAPNHVPIYVSTQMGDRRRHKFSAHVHSWNARFCPCINCRASMQTQFPMNNARSGK